jgi:hypothetical protein
VEAVAYLGEEAGLLSFLVAASFPSGAEGPSFPSGVEDLPSLEGVVPSCPEAAFREEVPSAWEVLSFHPEVEAHAWVGKPWEAERFLAPEVAWRSSQGLQRLERVQPNPWERQSSLERRFHDHLGCLCLDQPRPKQPHHRASSCPLLEEVLPPIKKPRTLL